MALLIFAAVFGFIFLAGAITVLGSAVFAHVVAVVIDFKDNVKAILTQIAAKRAAKKAGKAVTEEVKAEIKEAQDIIVEKE